MYAKNTLKIKKLKQKLQYVHLYFLKCMMSILTVVCINCDHDWYTLNKEISENVVVTNYRIYYEVSNNKYGDNIFSYYLKRLNVLKISEITVTPCNLLLICF